MEREILGSVASRYANGGAESKDRPRMAQGLLSCLQTDQASK